ncbi:AraC family transcriptional regulator [Paenibacillus sp. FSL H8-0548]|uniref:helix-turn-helix transcriptional regulator n=1 Tax=Paenibacillus sp. FSL H8-0548 TaxID=1920422 RepID=UPI00096CCD96|nr:AraC family transcriptional regulator [Paenibacillus sp. FSL H8-0548]
MQTEAYAQPIKEEVVVYPHPFLYLKVWEIDAPPAASGTEIFGPWHYHKEVEFLAVTEGSISIQTKDNYFSLDRGELVLLGSSELHRTHRTNTTPLKFVVFQVDLYRHFDQSDLPYLHGFSERTRPLSDLNYLFQQQPQVRQEAYSLILDIYNETLRQERGYELLIGAAIKRLLWLLIRYDTRQILQHNDSFEMIRLKPVFDYVEQHLQDKIVVEDVCKLLNFSYHYFIRYFQQTMGCSFITFVNHKRIKKAERLLLTQSLSITDVALEAGIPSTAQFYKLFKRYNQCSPKEFIVRMREMTDLA